MGLFFLSLSLIKERLNMNTDELGKISLRICLWVNTTLLIVDLLLVGYLLLNWWIGVPIESIRNLLINTSVDALLTYWIGGIINDFYFEGEAIIFGINIPRAPGNWFTIVTDLIYSFICINQIVKIISLFIS